MRARIIMLAATLTLVSACSSKSPLTYQGNTVIYQATLKGSNETPPNAEVSSGTATFTMSGNSMGYTVYVTGLTGPAMMAHIHLGATGVKGNVIYPFAVLPGLSTGTITTGTIDLTQSIFNGTISGDSLKTLFNNGNIYVNVHTTMYPAGEIRGQIIKQ